MALLINKIKTDLKELVTYTETLEDQLKNAQQNIIDLLEEDDIKQLPSYKLLYHTYRQDLRSATVSKKNNVSEDIYDTLHQPPTVRNKNKKTNLQVKRNIAEKSCVSYLDDVKQVTAEQQCYSTKNTPDFGENLLEDSLGPYIKKKINDLVVQATGRVYKVEIQGVTYYLNGTYLYSVKEQLRVGLIGTDFEIDGVHYPIEEIIQLAPDCEDYYISNKKAFILLNEQVSLCVGEINADDDICLFA